MRRAYVLYHPRRDAAGCVDTALPWPSDATLLFDTTELGFSCAGEARHHYDVVQAVQQRGDAALASILTWDDEVWVAVEIGDIEAGTSLKRVSHLPSVP